MYLSRAGVKQRYWVRSNVPVKGWHCPLVHQDAVSVHNMYAEEDGNGIAAFSDTGIEMFLGETQKEG